MTLVQRINFGFIDELSDDPTSAWTAIFPLVGALDDLAFSKFSIAVAAALRAAGASGKRLGFLTQFCSAVSDSLKVSKPKPGSGAASP